MFMRRWGGSLAIRLIIRLITDTDTHSTHSTQLGFFRASNLLLLDHRLPLGGGLAQHEEAKLRQNIRWYLRIASLQIFAEAGKTKMKM